MLLSNSSYYDMAHIGFSILFRALTTKRFEYRLVPFKTLITFHISRNSNPPNRWAIKFQRVMRARCRFLNVPIGFGLRHDKLAIAFLSVGRPSFFTWKNLCRYFIRKKKTRWCELMF